MYPLEKDGLGFSPCSFFKNQEMVQTPNHQSKPPNTGWLRSYGMKQPLTSDRVDGPKQTKISCGLPLKWASQKVQSP